MEGTSVVGSLSLSLSLSLFVIVVGKLECREGIQKELCDTKITCNAIYVFHLLAMSTVRRGFSVLVHVAILHDFHFPFLK
jgi:hypothetical protein